MEMGNLSYEECRQRRVEENQKRLEELNLTYLTQSLRNLSPKSSPMKKVGKPRTVETKMVPVRRSPRVANTSAPVYVEVKQTRLVSPRKSYGVSRRQSNQGSASEESIEIAFKKAQELVAKLESDGYPTLIRTMLPSHVTGCFWLLAEQGLPSYFCSSSMPKKDGLVTLMDEEGDEFPTVYLARKKGLSGGWKGFAEVHQLVHGDSVIFQVLTHSLLKVYIIRASDYEDEVVNKKD